MRRELGGAQGWEGKTASMPTDFVNKLYYGDNLDILREYVKDETVDLIYLDPPFNSKADYNVLFKTNLGEDSAAQAGAFKDTWEWDEAAAQAYHELMTSPRVPTNLRNLMEALKVFLTGDTSKKGNSMMAYLCMMALRLVELHRVLKPTGSLYLHCDPTASHYIKLILDAVFGHISFRNEIVWKRTTAHSDGKRCGRIHDIIFFYSKSKDYTWNKVYQPYEQDYVDKYYRYKDSDGRRYASGDVAAAGPGPARMFRGELREPPRGSHWRFSQEKIDLFVEEGRIFFTANGVPRYKRYLDEMPGVVVQDIWADKDVQPVVSWSDEGLGYPTQKPEALLERIIQASSNEGDLVLDPFCGCGTTIAVAERLKRNWIGIDVTYVSVDLMERRLIDMFTPNRNVNDLERIPVPKRRQALKEYWSKGADALSMEMQTGLRPYEVIGDPKDVASARFLAENDKYQFEWWAIRMIGAQGKEYKKGADRGIDGIISFPDGVQEYKRAVISVKGGNSTPANALRDLRGTMERERAVSGVLITLVPPTSAMKREIADAGRWSSTLDPSKSFPVLQVLTAQDLLDGKMPDIPNLGLDTGGRAKKVEKVVKQGNIFVGELE